MNIKDFVVLILVLIAIFILGTIVYGVGKGFMLVLGVHLVGVIFILINFITNSYVVSIKKKNTNNKEEIKGFKKFLIFLGLSLVWEVLILVNNNKA